MHPALRTGETPFADLRAGHEQRDRAFAGDDFEAVERLCRSLHEVTGHTQEDDGLDLNWASLADPDTTLIVYMGRTNVARIAERLIAHGLPPSTPSAAIVEGTRPDQRTLLTTLGELPDRVAALDCAAPTLLVIGRVVAMAGTLSWFDPLAASAAGSRSTG